MTVPALRDLVARVEVVAGELAVTGRDPQGAFVDALCRTYRLLGDELPQEQPDPHALGALHEQLLEHTPTWDGRTFRLVAGSKQRKARGSYFTPTGLVDHLLDQTLEPALDEAGDPLAVRILDPACGAGAFLVAAARRIAHRAGLDRPDGRVLACLAGVDQDPAAVELARLCLRLETGGDAVERVVVGDALTRPMPTAYDVVVGNPPFLNQLERLTASDADTRARLAADSGGAVRAYTDLSAVFLHRSVAWVRDGGRIGLVQPLSLLAARDAAEVRRHLAEACALESLWDSTSGLFGARVLTCAPVLRKGAPQGAVRRTHGPDFTPHQPVEDPDLSAEWSFLLAGALGTPRITLSEAGRLGDLAVCTADFRDQYYGLAGAVREARDCPDGVPLVTTGLIDPAESLWGRRPTRFLKQAWDAPVVDLSALDDGLAVWASARLVPKVLVGTQGKVIEAVADESGAWLPSVPTITVTAPPEQLWHVLAVLLAPPVAAHAAASYAGTALSAHAIKLSASQVTGLPLPVDQEAWHQGARLAERAQQDDEQRAQHLWRLGAVMCTAYGVGSDVLDWWRERAGLSGRP